jgi:hypothetical protein
MTARARSSGASVTVRQGSVSAVVTIFSSAFSRLLKLSLTRFMANGGI